MLKFYFGTMGSGKSAELIYETRMLKAHGFTYEVLKPSTDTRDGNFVKSRNGDTVPCKFFKPGDIKSAIIQASENDCVDYIFIDEAQFMTKEDVETLVKYTILYDDLKVFCYGILTDYMSNMFEGSKRLVELADKTQELTMMCNCGKLAKQNGKFVDGKIVYEGEQLGIGGDETYRAVCSKCYFGGKL